MKRSAWGLPAPQPPASLPAISLALHHPRLLLLLLLVGGFFSGLGGAYNGEWREAECLRGHSYQPCQGLRQCRLLLDALLTVLGARPRTRPSAESK